LFNGAEEETRTLNSLLGRQALYQLSYFRLLKLTLIKISN